MRPWSVLVCMVACDQGGEYRPLFFESPSRTVTHGRFEEAWYHKSGTHSQKPYALLTFDGSPIRIPGSHVRYASPCEVEGIEAMGLNVRGEAPGYYIAQWTGEALRTTKVCDFASSPGRWDGAVFRPPCDKAWDALSQQIVPAKVGG